LLTEAKHIFVTGKKINILINFNLKELKRLKLKEINKNYTYTYTHTYLYIYIYIKKTQQNDYNYKIKPNLKLTKTIILT